MKLFSSLVLITAVTLCPPTVLAKEPIKTEKASQQLIQNIDINRASIEELSALKGIGSKKAQAIVEYRKINGNFASLDELLNVKGIGEKVLSDNKARLKI